VPDEDFVCETTRCTELDVGLDAAPGVCPGGERQLMLSVRNDSHESLMVQRGLPLAVAVETIAELASSVPPDSLSGEEIAKRAVKTGDFTTEAVLEVLRKMKIPSAIRGITFCRWVSRRSGRCCWAFTVMDPISACRLRRRNSPGAFA
jgi:hypothetical protein